MLYLHNISGKLLVYQYLSLCFLKICCIAQLSSEKGVISALEFPLKNIVLHSIRVLLGIHCVYGMVGNPVAFLLSMSMVMVLLLIMQ